MTCTITHSTNAPDDRPATIIGNRPRRPLPWSVALLIIDTEGTTLQLDARTTTPCMVTDLPAVVGRLIDEAVDDLRETNLELTANYVQWRASARGGSKKNRKGGRR